MIVEKLDERVVVMVRRVASALALEARLLGGGGAGARRPRCSRQTASELPRRAPDSRAREVRCTITKFASSDHRGETVSGDTSDEPCSVLKLPGEDADISARIGSSPDGPSTAPGRDDAVLLLGITTRANVLDVIEVAGIKLQVTAISACYDSVGKLAHYVVQAAICAARREEIRGERCDRCGSVPQSTAGAEQRHAAQSCTSPVARIDVGARPLRAGEGASHAVVPRG